MVTNYTITLTLKDEDVSKLNNAGFKLCFAAGVGDSGEKFTVIARATIVSNHVTINWTDEYWIAASNEQYDAGVKFSVANNMSTITFKEKYTLPRDWTTGKVTSDPSLDDGTFLFHNATEGDASAVVYTKIHGVATPIYITPNFVFADGDEVLKPKKEVALWAQKDVETGLMISKNSSKLKIFDVSGGSTLKAHWNGHEFEKD